MFLILTSLAFLSACETDRARIANSEQAKVERDAIHRVAKSAARQQPLPEQPTDCRKRQLAGVIGKDKADVVIIKYDRALGRANERVSRCSNWFERVKKSHSGGR